MVTDLQPGEVVLALDTNEFGVKTSGGDMLWTATLDPQTGKLQQTDGLLQTSDRGAAGGVAALPVTLPATGSLLQMGAGGTVQAATDASGAAAMSGKLPKILTGIENVVPDVANEMKTVHVNFPPGFFSNAPIIAITARTTVPQNMYYAQSGQTKDGFDIYFLRTTTTLTALNWIAIQA